MFSNFDHQSKVVKRNYLDTFTPFPLNVHISNGCPMSKNKWPPREKLFYLLQNQTRTTSFSIQRLSPIIRISSEVGFGFLMKARSSATLTVLSIEVRFLRLLPIRSAQICALGVVVGWPEMELSASSNHFSSKGFSLHMFLKERFKASNLDMVVWEKSLPYIFPIAKPTSPWV